MSTYSFTKLSVHGKQVTALLDSGSSMSLFWSELVPVSTVDYRQEEDILFVHGDNQPYPTAELTVTFDCHLYSCFQTLTVISLMVVHRALGSPDADACLKSS